jgi:hypothetical protein
MGTAIRICQRSAAAQRLWIALVISLFVHYLAVQGWQGGGARSTAEVPLLQARLERLPMVAAVAAPEILDVVESRDTLQPQAVRPVQQIPSPPSTTPAAGKINGGPVRMRELDLIRARGMQAPVAICEVLEHHTAESFPHMDEVIFSFAEAVAHYRNRSWSRAIALFNEALAACPGDRPSLLYRERCEFYAKQPPPEDWDGVWTLPV